MNYEALGRYTAAKQTAVDALRARNQTLLAVRRWAEPATSDQGIVMAFEPVQRLLAKARAADDAWHAAVLDANAVAELANQPRLHTQLSTFQE